MSALARGASLVLTGALVLAMLAGCARTDAPATLEGSRAGNGSSQEEAQARPSASQAPSLFELDFPLTDADGRARHLREFAGGPIVASMVYTSCRSVCPRITADLQALDRALPADLRSRTRFLLFSLDPGRDTPAALTAFAREHALDQRWTLLAASEDDMRTLAAVLDVRFRPDADGEIAHSAVIAVADDRGVLRHHQVGLGQGVESLVAAVRSASEGAAGTRPARR